MCKHNLALPTWGQKCIVYLLQPFEVSSFWVKHPGDCMLDPVLLKNKYFESYFQIFLILWFWYGFLTIFGISRLIYRIIQCSSSQLRYFIIRMHIHRYFHAHGHMRHVEHYIKKCSYGDWFVLYQMSRNMNRRFFAEFLTLLR